MKIRQDFVTNSSSSCFLVSVDNLSRLRNVTLTIKVNLFDFIDCEDGKKTIYKTAKDVEKFYDRWHVEEHKKEILDEIKKGNVVAEINVASDDDDPISRYLYEIYSEGRNEDMSAMFGNGVEVIE